MSFAKNAEASAIKFLDDGVYIVEKGGVKKRIADPIQVTALGTSEPGTARELAYTAVRFLDREGKRKKEIVPSSMLVSQPGEFVTLLAERGYVWPPTQPQRHKIVGELSIVKPVRRIRVTPVPGCHGKSYVLPGESYTPKGPDRRHFQLCHNPTVRLGEFRRSGTLKEWKEHVAKPCIHSTRARLAIAAVFAAPNLRALNINSFGFNFSGVTSGGKTLCVRWGASAAGLNSSEGPTTWDGSAAGFEQRALGHRDSIVLFDDMSHLPQPELAKLVTFRLASNRPKTRAGQYVLANNLVDLDWRVITLSTSEDPIWQQIIKPKRRCVRGEEVRLINVPACVSDKGDIFDGPNADERVGSTLEKRLDFVEKQENFTQDYQGEAFRTYLAKRFADQRAVATLRRYMDRFLEAAPLPRQFRWLGRMRRLFAVVYASGAQAIDYGVLPWSKKATLNAIIACMTDAMDQLPTNFSNSPDGGVARFKSDDALVGEFKRRVEDAKFVRIGCNSRKPHSTAKRLKNADGFIQSTRPGRVRYLLRSKAMETWFPHVTTRKHLTAVLHSRGILKAGRRTDTRTRQIHIAPLKKRVSCYALLRKRISE
jgi:putative DNA primase/helicase